MMTLVITENSFVAACHPDFPLEEIISGNAPNVFGNVFIQAGRNTTVVRTAGCNNETALLVVGHGGRGFFEQFHSSDRMSVFERCIRIGLRSQDKKIALNPKWMPYRYNNRTSLFASSNSDLRIISEKNFLGSNNTYIFDVVASSLAQDLSACEPDTSIYKEALTEFRELLEKSEVSSIEIQDSVVLERLPTASISKGFAYEEWLPLLSIQQRDFVERKITGPLRVRGAAGTGKTLAMVMKVLKICKESIDNPKRILFLTHSWAMAGQVDEMLRDIGRDIPTAPLVDVYPLLEISNQRNYLAVGRKPLGLDSDSGKRETLKVIDSIIKNFLVGDWIAYQSGCSAEFSKNFMAPADSRERRNLSWDLLIEFGCVLAAQGMLGRERDRERYLRVRRVGYMMTLRTVTEKEVVFRLWGAFLGYLKDEGLISSDQIVSDYLNDLQTFYWEAKRSKDGYDYIFVDEMHLFNAQERLVFHNLLADGDAVPRVVLALDPKQSPREVFAEVTEEGDVKSSSIYERAGLPNPEKVDFLDIFRYTNEISILAKAILDAVPALDMNDDWNLSSGTSVVGSGPTPTYYLETDRIRVFKRAISTAMMLQTEARQRGGQVAILCMDYERFEVYHSAAIGQFPKEMFLISSRDDVEKLRYMGRRIVISMPEYVAGLQFDSVVLVDVNGNLVPDTNFRGHQERRFLSELYLGISRAQKVLALIASRDSEGLTPYLKRQETKGFLKIADIAG